MKKTIVLLLAIVPALAWAQEGSYTINGQVKNLNKTAKKVYLMHRENGQIVIDSAAVVNNKYQLKGTVGETAQAMLQLNVSDRRAIKAPGDVKVIFLEPATFEITHTDSFSNTVTKGSVANAEFKKLEDAEKPLNERGKELNEAYKNAQKSMNAAAMKQVEAQFDSLEAVSKDKIYGPYVKANPSSPLALYALNLYTGYGDVDLPNVEPLFNALPAATQASKGGQAFKARLDAVKKTAMGSVAEDFTQNDTLGKPVSLSSFRGNYVLVDFWASWCGPCRRENPNVVKAFNKYKDKGFHIIGVSLDQPGAQQAWLDAIHKDGLAWTHVSDLQFWNNAVAKEYGIQSIPANFLIDPTGKIIGKSLRGEDLDAKLAEVYKN